MGIAGKKPRVAPSDIFKVLLSMPLSWNEIKTRAAAFVNEWKDKAALAWEEADAQSFQIEFFNIFGVDRKKVAVFENKVNFIKLTGYSLDAGKS